MIGWPLHCIIHCICDASQDVKPLTTMVISTAHNLFKVARVPWWSLRYAGATDTRKARSSRCKTGNPTLHEGTRARRVTA